MKRVSSVTAAALVVFMGLVPALFAAGGSGEAFRDAPSSVPVPNSASGGSTAKPATGTPAAPNPPAPAADSAPGDKVQAGGEGVMPSQPEVLGPGKPPPDVQKEIERNREVEAKAKALRDAAREHPTEIGYQVAWLQGLLDLNRLDEALDAAPGLIEKFPHSAELFVTFGRVLLREGQFDLATVQFQRAIALDATNARTHSLAARASFIRGDLKPAEAGFRTALSLDPNLQEARTSLSILLERSGRYSDALA